MPKRQSNWKCEWCNYDDDSYDEVEEHEQTCDSKPAYPLDNPVTYEWAGVTCANCVEGCTECPRHSKYPCTCHQNSLPGL